ncbi:MAG: peptidoglycan DD-metalloendopeptidase family protein [Lysobacterales bacterium]
MASTLKITLVRVAVAGLMLAITACSYRAAPPEKRRSAPRYEPVAKGSTRIQRPSHYTVKRGDTLYAIAWRYGLDHRDLARWNRVNPPFVIHPDQALRLYPPRVAIATATPVAKPVGAGVRVLPTESKGSQRGPEDVDATPSTIGSTTPNLPNVKTQTLPIGRSSTASTRPAKKPTPKPASRPPKAAAGGASWGWPLTGKVTSEFSNAAPNLQGLDIRAPTGSDVLAAGAGEVVYSGSGLAGYGELIIIKHSSRYLSAYAYNRQRFVSEGQTVALGQKIAEVGKNGGENPRLHFQVRENGKPVDPRKYLPKR